MFIWAPDDLNPEQEAAIEEPGSVFLVACPGSGKTRTLTYKIARLLSTLPSEKAWVIAITYTHRAADEIEERIERLPVSTTRSPSRPRTCQMLQRNKAGTCGSQIWVMPSARVARSNHLLATWNATIHLHMI